MRAALWLTAVFWVAALAGCPTLPAPVLCGEIPEGGCPVGRGGTCDDAACAALYDCVDGQWLRTEPCARGDAGAQSDAALGPETDAGACTEVPFDPSGDATGCIPDLQSPDCPAAAALPCAETACSTGCVDFFRCVEQGGARSWVAVAHCTEEGQLVLDP